MIQTLRQFEFLPVAATAACLRSVGRIDLNYLFTSIFRFVFKCVKKHAPGGVSDTFVETAEFPHIVDLQVFYNNSIKRVNELSGLLMGKVMALVSNPLMNSGHNFSGFSAFRRALNLFGEFTLRFRQSLFFPAQKSGVFNHFCAGKCCKVIDSHVNADNGFNRLCDRHMLDITGQAHKPFSGLSPADGAGFDLALDRSVFSYLDAAYLGEPYVVILNSESTILRESEGIVPKLTTKAWITRFLTSFDPLEESSECQIYPHRNVLQHLRIDRLKELVFFLEIWQRFALIKSAEGFFKLFPSRFALLKKVIIQPSTSIKSRFKRMLLSATGIDPIFESFSHIPTLRKGSVYVKAS